VEQAQDVIVHGLDRLRQAEDVELSGFLGTKIHGLSTDVQCETLSQHRSITMTQFLT
ncbi:hypothetical protein N657DRAFT_651424, partial [Parathielavia appendiculata]